MARAVGDLEGSLAQAAALLSWQCGCMTAKAGRTTQPLLFQAISALAASWRWARDILLPASTDIHNGGHTGNESLQGKGPEALLDSDNRFIEEWLRYCWNVCWTKDGPKWSNMVSHSQKSQFGQEIDLALNHTYLPARPIWTKVV